MVPLGAGVEGLLVGRYLNRRGSLTHIEGRTDEEMTLEELRLGEVTPSVHLVFCSVHRGIQVASQPLGLARFLLQHGQLESKKELGALFLHIDEILKANLALLDHGTELALNGNDVILWTCHLHKLLMTSTDIPTSTCEFGNAVVKGDYVNVVTRL